MTKPIKAIVVPAAIFFSTSRATKFTKVIAGPVARCCAISKEIRFMREIAVQVVTSSSIRRSGLIPKNLPPSYTPLALFDFNQACSKGGAFPADDLLDVL